MRSTRVIEMEVLDLERSEARGALYGRFESVLLAGLLATLMFGVLAAGATQPWSALTMQIASVALLGCWLAQQLTAPVPRIAWNALAMPVALWGMLVAAQAAGLSTYVEVSRGQAVMYAAFAMLMFISTQVFSRSAALVKILPALSLFGFVLAIFGIVSVVAGNGKLYWFHELKFEGGWIVGPYVNHNHFAGAVELLLPFPLLATLSRNRPPESRAMYAFTALLLITALLLSQSRGGTLALAGELIFAILVIMFRWRARRLALTALAVAVASLGFLWWLGSEQVAERLGNLNEPMRLAISRDSLVMFRVHPWLGWGIGVFPLAYPRFQSFYSRFFINAAHNDFAQFLVETGIIGIGLILWVLIVLYRVGIRQTGDEPSESRLVRLAALTSVTALLIHSWFDFNLQIPANAALFYVMCTIAVQNRDSVLKFRSDTPAD